MPKPIVKTAIILFFIIIGLVIVHHQIIHDGAPFQSLDFQNSFYFLIKSHEGIITIMLIGGAGVVFGVYLQKEYKLK